MKRGRLLLWSLFVGLVFGGTLAFWLNSELTPMTEGKEFFFRVEKQSAIADVLSELQAKGAVRNANALRIYSRLKRFPQVISPGTYQLHPGMKALEILNALLLPVKRMVRLSESNWASRNAMILEENDVAAASEYTDLVKKPAEFSDTVSFPLPKKGSLEGYLYPDTYDLPPKLGARGAVERQLKAFEDKVWNGLDHPTNLQRALIIASLVQMEVAKDQERPIVAGVIENRLKLNMPLQIDAAVLYGMGTWKELTQAEIAKADSKYNTYLHAGLPPGPICSPSLKSIEAALHPVKHGFLYYVALPEGRHLFAATYEQHLANVRKRKQALAAQPK